MAFVLFAPVKSPADIGRNNLGPQTLPKSAGLVYHSVLCCERLTPKTFDSIWNISFLLFFVLFFFQKCLTMNLGVGQSTPVYLSKILVNGG